MTTIVYRDGVLAADSLGVSNGSTKLPGAFQKPWRLEDGTLLGGAGEYNRVTSAILNVKAVLDVKCMDEYSGSAILCARPNRSLLLNERGLKTELGSPDFYAIGSGAVAALGALHNGASAEEAIVAASRVDVFTDDRVQTLRFGGPAIVPPAPSEQVPEKAAAIRFGWARRLLGM